MFWIIFIFLFIPSYVWPMDEESSDDNSSFVSAQMDEPTSYGAESSLIGANQQTPTPFVTPRTARSNSVYMAAVQEVQERLRTPRQQESLDGLSELEEGLGVGASVQSELTEDQIAEYFYNRLQGKKLPGIGVFNADDNNQCTDLRNLIGMIKRFAPKKYTRIVRSIGRGRSSRYPNNDLIDVLTKIVGSIDSLNENTNHVAREQYDMLRTQMEIMEKRFKVEQDNFKLAKQTSENTTRRYRMSTLWALIGGGVTVVVTNLLQHFLSTVGAIDMSEQMMRNTTMS